MYKLASNQENPDKPTQENSSTPNIKGGAKYTHNYMVLLHPTMHVECGANEYMHILATYALSQYFF